MESAESGKEVSHWDAVPSLTEAKVGMLRYSELTTEEKKRLRDRFDLYLGNDRTPSWPVVSVRDQELLADAFDEISIPLEPLAELLSFLGLNEVERAVRLPGRQQDMALLTGCEEHVVGALKELYVAEPDPTSMRRIEAKARLDALYRGLEVSAKNSRTVTDPDVVLVFGARRDGAKKRAQKAAKIVIDHSANTNMRVILSGWHPYYDSRFTFGGEPGEHLPFGEAEAMAVSFEEAMEDWDVVPFAANPALPRMVVDPRARTSLESIVHSVPVLIETWAALERPLKIQLVTSPYHAQRTWSLATVKYHHFLDWETIVESLTVAVSDTGLDRSKLLNPRSEQHLPAVALYVRESVKLIGGRMTGEF